MNFFIYILLIGGLSIKIGEAVTSNDILKYLEDFTNSGKKKAGKDLKLSDDEILGLTEFSVVWLGYYNKSLPVAIKIFGDVDLMEIELAIFTHLNAISNVNVQQYGIPTVYYSGEIVKKFYGIAMTLCEGTLKNYYWRQNLCISYFNILSIFKQIVHALQYLNRMEIVHNDIKPTNILYRGDKFYISDFGVATHNGAQNDMGTKKFASSNYHGKQPRGPTDDLESLVFTMWYVSGIKLGSKSVWTRKKYEGEILNKSSKQEYIARVDKNLKKFDDNPIVRDVIRYICVDEMLAEKSAPDYTPDYDLIISKLDEAINQIGGPSSSA